MQKISKWTWGGLRLSASSPEEVALGPGVLGLSVESLIVLFEQECSRKFFKSIPVGFLCLSHLKKKGKEGGGVASHA